VDVVRPPLLNGLFPALGGLGIEVGDVGVAVGDENGLLAGRAVGVAARDGGVAPSTIFCNSGGRSSTFTDCFSRPFAGAFFAFAAWLSRH
jgi:hypothetical protein